MRHLALLVLFSLAGCGVPESTELRLVTIETPQAVGLSLRELPPPLLKSIGLRYGLAVVKTGAAAERAGLRVGDVVYGVNERRIGNVEDFGRLVAQRQADGNLGLLVRRGKTDFYVPMDFTAAQRRPPGMPKSGPSAPPRDTPLRT